MRFDERHEIGRAPRWRTAAIATAALAAALILATCGDNAPPNRPALRDIPARDDVPLPQRGGGPSWVKIAYDDLIDRATITHSGRTVGGLLAGIDKSRRGFAERDYSDLQPYLEPFSFVCNDVVSAAQGSDPDSYGSIVAGYPAGSRQPAWAALFREGHYQLFVGEGKMRLFLEGENAAQLFSRQRSVFRHAVTEALEAAGTDTMTVEVYAFVNDYASRAIRLDLNPYVTEISRKRLTAAGKEIPLARLAEFFDQGVTLEAAGIDENGEFCLYGSPSARPTVAGFPQSLEDFAVVYRSVFHHGRNAPYISLDRHEDNRYAKVNFGGLLEDTRVGSVVLEADKLFKTMCTGLDPNTRTFVKGNILGAVPDFETSSERALDENLSGYSVMRYWFYPDRIQAVTDGRIGVVQNCRFLADAERMDRKVAIARSERETIDHLNANFARYAQALPAYRELNTVGRMMAIVNWLRESGVREEVDLDALLSVELPAFTTPRRTRRLVAVTAAVTADGGPAAVEGGPRRVYCLDGVLDGVKPSAGDREIIEAANLRFSGMQDLELLPAGVRNRHAEMDAAEAQVIDMDAKLKSLRSRIDRERLQRNSSGEDNVSGIDASAEEFNSLKAKYDEAAASYHRLRREGRSIRFLRHTITSIGGGINLRPDDFAKATRNPDSPLIRRIRSAQGIIRSSPSGKSGSGAARVTAPGRAAATAASPSSARREGGGGRTAVESAGKTRTKSARRAMGVERDGAPGSARRRIATKGDSNETAARPGEREVVISNSSYPAEIVATGSFANGGTIVLRKGRKIGAR